MNTKDTPVYIVLHIIVRDKCSYRIYSNNSPGVYFDFFISSPAIIRGPAFIRDQAIICKFIGVYCKGVYC